MKLGVLVDLIHTNINGGRPSTDSVVTKAQIKALIPAAVNYALTGDYWANMEREGDKEVPGSFITELSPRYVCVDERGRDYIDLPEPLSNIGGGGGIRYIQDSMGNIYAPRPQGTSPGYWDDVLCSLREYQQIGKKVLIFNKPELVDHLFPGVILDASQLSNDDELPIPAGQEPQVIDILNAFFNKQRMNPKDYIINGVDPINEVNNV